MIEIHRILCPTDLSDVAGRAFELAVVLARSHGAEVELATVHETLLPGPAGPTGYPPWAVLDPALRGRLLSALVTAAADATAHGIAVRTAVYEGRVVAEIVERARHWPADLVVMGTHGRSGFERWVLGSVTEKALHKMPCPVLVVPPAPAAAAGAAAMPAAPPFRRILCAIDFSPASLRALRYAAKLQEAGVELTVLHVVEWQFEDEPGARLAGFDVPEFRRYLDEDARERLDRTLRDELGARPAVRAQVAGGRSWREVLRAAQEGQADLVVMGVRGRGPVDLTLFGSTTQHVVRGAACPVLVVHGESQAPARLPPRGSA
jgi:nucleotide-binding universal stress UspA family protein